MGRKKNASPRQAARAALVEKYGLRNSRKGNYWLVRCPMSGMDWAFDSDVRVEHYYACEGDPEVLKADYSVQRLPIALANGSVIARFDAQVELLDGAVEMRRVETVAERERGTDETLERACDALVSAMGRRYRRVTIHQIDDLAQRITNWRKGYQFVRAARLLETRAVESDVLLRIGQHGRIGLAHLRESLPALDPSLVVASALRLLRRREIESDLDTSPFSKSTELRRKRGAR